MEANSMENEAIKPIEQEEDEHDGPDDAYDDDGRFDEGPKFRYRVRTTVQVTYVNEKVIEAANWEEARLEASSFAQILEIDHDGDGYHDTTLTVNSVQFENTSRGDK
jgi:hypothetical protein